MAQYPGSDPTFTTKTDAVDDVQAAHVNAVQDEIAAIGAALRGTLTHDVKLAADKHVYENGSAVAMGAWTAPTFSAGDFTASGSMTWTVGAADVGAYVYTIIGKTLILSFRLASTDVGGTASNALRIAVPAGKQIARDALTPCVVSDAGAAVAIGYLNAQASAPGYVAVQKIDASNWTLGSGTAVYGQIALEIA